MNNGLSYIRRWMWLFLLIVVLTAAAAFILVYNEISSTLDAYHPEAPSISPNNPQTAQATSATIKLRVLLVLTVSYLSILVLSIVWLRSALRQINRPLQKIQRAVNNLAQGKLSETVDISSPDEFGQIGSGINELAANLQELLLYIWKQTGQCLHVIEEIGLDKRRVYDESSQRQVEEQIQSLRESIENLREMAKAYVFYDVHLEGDKTLAINQPGAQASPNASLAAED